MKFRNLSLGFKIGIIMAFIPLIVAIFDFFVFCKAGDNLGEGCGFLTFIITLPFLSLIQFVLWPIKFISDSFYFSPIGYTIGAMVIYFLIGVLIVKVILKIKNKIAKRDKSSNFPNG